MRVEIDPDRVTKIAESPDDRVALRHEAVALRMCAHPGVVPLLGVEGGDPPDALVTRRASGGHLDPQGDRSLRSVVRWGSAIAATLGDLHEVGWVHGAVAADHVLFDGEGRPMLCGFRSAEAPTDRADLIRGAAADAAALARLLLESLPEGSDRRVVRFLAAAAGQSPEAHPAGRLAPRAVRPRSGRAISARQMARRLVELVPDARLIADPAPGPPLQPLVGAPASTHRRRLVRAAAALGLCVGLAAVGMTFAPSARRRGSAVAAGLTISGADRYLLSGPPGADLVTLVGRWGCRSPRPAVVDLRTGWIWVFDRWPPPGSAEVGHVAGHVPQATAVAVRRAGSSCDELVALGGSGRQTVVPVPAR